MVNPVNADARDKARAYYAGSGRCLQEDMAALAAHPHGVVLFLPELVVLLKAVDHTQPETWAVLPSRFAREDGWYIHLLAGDLHLARRLAHLLPARPWLCFHRGQRHTRPHIRRWEDVLPRSSEHINTQKGITHHGIC